MAAAFPRASVWPGLMRHAYSRARSPETCPVQQVTKIELVINLNTAKALGLSVSQDMLSIADEVIE
jgi:putative tryptophan/tyrosine transport system substrate-binding protein